MVGARAGEDAGFSLGGGVGGVIHESTINFYPNDVQIILTPFTWGVFKRCKDEARPSGRLTFSRTKIMSVRTKTVAQRSGAMVERDPGSIWRPLPLGDQRHHSGCDDSCLVVERRVASIGSYV